MMELEVVAVEEMISTGLSCSYWEFCSKFKNEKRPR